ncbi:hypothetical protein N483_13765 [Pseudoalteromonas luteoviolacea NCIMB 1944]|uniref:Uncharacterized protein n=1 Tax=Pseudoalteromonas luteoviolacea (strain 2ta16) TaxID=1353533 RepID=V4HLN5_PSEL2|nr:hypothetical protein PL2TA16_01797 [Pseudoalteromonas luteoviolacea 2ta16]KZN41732.1 hypothetical protein N483_13765 [Pseudoalteromonas luteoviolacea NCIMB 1944]
MRCLGRQQKVPIYVGYGYLRAARNSGYAVSGKIHFLVYMENLASDLLYFFEVKRPSATGTNSWCSMYLKKHGSND